MESFCDLTYNLQGALADIFLRSTDLVTDARGMASMVQLLSANNLSILVR